MGVGAGFEASVGIVLLKESAVEIGHAHFLSEDTRVVEVIVGLAVGVERVEEEMLKHFMDKVGLLLRSGFPEELGHELELARAPAAAIGHAHPAFLLQEVEEDDAPEQLLDIVAHTLLVAAESLHNSFVGRVLRVFLPLVGLLARGVEHKLGVVLAVLVEELLRECLHGEGVLDVPNLHALPFGVLLEQLEEVLRGSAARVVGAEKEGEALSVGRLFVFVGFIAEGEAPLVSAGVLVTEDHEGTG